MELLRKRSGPKSQGGQRQDDIEPLRAQLLEAMSTIVESDIQMATLRVQALGLEVGFEWYLNVTFDRPYRWARQGELKGAVSER